MVLSLLGREVVSMTIGERVKDARQRRFLTQDELSEATGIRIVTISRIENDRVESQPRLSTMKKIAEALQVSPRWLMFGETEEELEGKEAA